MHIPLSRSWGEQRAQAQENQKYTINLRNFGCYRRVMEHRRKLKHEVCSMLTARDRN